MASPLPVLIGRWPSDAQMRSDTDVGWIDDHPISDWSGVVSRLGDIEGSFALAWTDDAGSLHLARDPMGHRSLFYALEPLGAVIYSTRVSELIQRRSVPARVNDAAILPFLCYAYLPGEQTLIRDVYAVAPGTHLVFHKDGTRTRESFWSLPAAPTHFAPMETLQRQLRLELELTIVRCLEGGPCGGSWAASLSGGVDSSAVVAVLRRSTSHPIEAWSLNFGPKLPNELEFSAAVAAHCGLQHRVVTVTPGDVERYFDATIRAQSEPNGDPLTVPNYLLFHHASEDSDVVFNGEGGDPCFGGPKNAPMLLAELYGDDSRERSYLRAHQRCFDDLPLMLTGEADVASLEQPLQSLFEDSRWSAFLDRLVAINIQYKGGWHILPKVEHLAAVHGIRPRSPLFARSMVQLSTQIPASLKRSGAVEKFLFKEAVADLLPRAIIDRPKSGMLVPVEYWFSGPLLAMAKARLLESPVLHRWIKKSWLEDLIFKRHGGLRPRRGIKIWMLMTLEAYLRHLLELRHA